MEDFINKNSKSYRRNKAKISAVETTSDRLTGRAGLSLFVAYLHRIEIFGFLDRFFGSMRKNRKGTAVFELFKQVLDFASRRGSWKTFRRTIYCRLVHDCKGQMVLPGCRPDTVIITNIGQGQPIDRLLKEAGAEEYLEARGIVSCYHERGSDELANRALKDFGHEQLPFKKFHPNAAWYYSMLLGHFFLESFKEDVGAPVVAVGAYANTVRRRLVDIAGKIVSHGGKVVLKVTRACFENLGLSELFDRCYRAPIIV